MITRAEHQADLELLRAMRDRLAALYPDDFELAALVNRVAVDVAKELAEGPDIIIEVED
jgi:hypothetical protein